MTSPSEFEEAKSRAERTIRTLWRDIARSYTLGWGGPIEDIESAFPFVRDAILSIRHQISPDFPVVLFQSRESPPKDMIAAVAFWKDTGNPFNCRLATVRTLSQEETKLYSDFAQAFWFSIQTKLLPAPRDGQRFQAAILAWTGEALFKIES
jgi:hypothetical protein